MPKQEQDFLPRTPNRGLVRRGRSWLLILFFLFAFQLGTAKKAEALGIVFDYWAWGIEAEQILIDAFGFKTANASYAAILATYYLIYDLWKENLNGNIPDAIAANRDATIEGIGAYIETIIDLTQAIVDDNLLDTIMGVQLTGTTKGVSREATDESDQIVCNQIEACQGPVIMSAFADQVMAIVIDGISMMDRFTGNNPTFVNDEAAARCGENLAGIVFGNPVDGYDTSCQALSTSSLTSNADRDISSNVLSPNSVLQVPELSTETFTLPTGETMSFSKPNVDAGSPALADKAEKVGWVAAVNYCARLAGLRPPVPGATESSTISGPVMKAQWNRCNSIRNEFIAACAKRVGKLSRPDCGSADYASVCEPLLRSCNSGRQTHVGLPASFRNCAAGTNYYQAGYLCTTICDAPAELQAQELSGEERAKALKKIEECKKNRQKWERSVQEDEAAFNKAVARAEGLKKCWAQIR